MRFTLTTKLLAAFSALALVAALPGAGLLVGILRLERTAHQNHRDLESRDAVDRARGATNLAVTGTGNHTLFPDDARFSESARTSLSTAERALKTAAAGLRAQEAEALNGEFADLQRTAGRVLDATSPTAAPQRRYSRACSRCRSPSM